MDIHEVLVGLCHMTDTSGKALKDMIINFLKQNKISIEALRSQVYDGAANMSGAVNGCQALIKNMQPLASFYHCESHITHLVCSKAVSESSLIRDALDQLQELGNFYNASGKFKNLYLDGNDLENVEITPLKPICPTRFLTRSPAIIAILNNYSAVQSALETASKNFGSTTAARANGLYRYLGTAKCVLGLVAAKPIVTLLENLN